MQKFSIIDYDIIQEFAFSKFNPGYKPQVIESPNGDGVWDYQKKYAHLAPKYFDAVKDINIDHIKTYYNIAKEASIDTCNKLGLSEQFWPGTDSTLRVLYYPPGATTAPHTDFDLFTISMFRDNTDAFKYLSGEEDELLSKAKAISPGIHFGEIMSEINGAKATSHEVLGSEEPQHAIVFFVVPDHNSILPSGLSIGEWMEERKLRSRKI